MADSLALQNQLLLQELEKKRRIRKQIQVGQSHELSQSYYLSHLNQRFRLKHQNHLLQDYAEFASASMRYVDEFTTLMQKPVCESQGLLTFDRQMTG
jgi:hypothetical protein